MSVLNFNVGILGHVDSGKTSLSKVLSTIESTAAFDKNPQSQERGITIDLGFSSFSVEAPEHIQQSGYETLQFTLVDCPGHAALIRTIIGGCHIIDLFILVVDVTKGIQTQTAECIVLGDITCGHMVVALNKVDLLPPEKKNMTMQKTMKKILTVLEKTKFKNSVIVPVAANPSTGDPMGISDLIDQLKAHSYVPIRRRDLQLLFAVDHCFSIKGQGTVMTGTVLHGEVKISDSIEISSQKMERKVKSIQMFKKPVTRASAGDRVGICVTQFNPKLLERGYVGTPGFMHSVDQAVVSFNSIPYFKGRVASGSKFHISVMHDTVMARCTFWGSASEGDFDISQDYIYLDEIPDDKSKNSDKPCGVFALLQFEKPVIVTEVSKYIASRLETDIHANVCRLAFHGRFLAMDFSPDALRVYKEKSREGVVERLSNEYQVIVRDLFKKETDIGVFANLKVTLSTGEVGVIDSSFGQSGKVNVRIPNGLLPSTAAVLKCSKKGKKEVMGESVKVTLKFRKFVYGDKKKIYQV